MLRCQISPAIGVFIGLAINAAFSLNGTGSQDIGEASRMKA
jgi:hypothetical protein